MKLNFKRAVSAVQESQQAPVSDHRILIVDDETPNLQTMSAILERQFKVVTATSGGEALEIIEKAGSREGFSAIISDHIMPRMTGVELCSELRRRQYPAPRIIVTGFAELGNVIAAINEAAIFRYLTKPLEKTMLLRAVSEAVAQYETREENGRLTMMVKELLETSAELAKICFTHGLEDEIAQLGIPDVAEPRKIELAVLFADVRGFTKLSSTTGAREVISVLQRLFQPIHQIIYDSGGIVDKHLGDGLMAVFGLSGGSSVQAALGAAKRAVEACPSIIGQLEPGFRGMKLSFGLACGEVVIGVIGSDRRSELAVIGQPANLASRLQEFTKNALNGRQSVLGDFPTAMAVCDGQMLVGETVFAPTDLPESERIRDFASIAKVGVFRA
jgi:class 3 adenylate cyclase/CheY-like chemotaxis protein